ncbi:hypothetical protein CBR_g34786 [Chara braunii]|uniref:Peptidase C19 ubiquitin carboxyl-terminal hydrolase domain-containing protein n=1 Tax=Chara braunii TaxID=69332 RepID=A0A388LJA5_CHABU|nr:hypothetical protein CBR_g34786 [Chara braunii]|eukprot:GBG82410.1 hypothetical protein CBR_g34786 [Chara braunii]
MWLLGWQKTRENIEDIRSTLKAIDTDIDIGIIYDGVDKGMRHRLVSVACYYGQHYHCFALNQDLDQWIKFDDSNVKVR